MANYPTSAPSFPSRSAGQTIGSAHMNGVQDEVVAIGTVLVNSLNVAANVVTSVKFPASQTASSDANTLDDYEEGSWTPTDQSGASLSFSVAQGSYVKIGQIVVAACAVTFPSTASGAGVVIGGLPFTVEAAGGQSFWGGLFSFTTVGNPSGTVLCVTNTTTFQIFTEAGATRINSDFSLKNNKFVLIYRASA